MRELAADVLIVGAGPAGLAAAAAAAAGGARVLVIDENPAAGGQIWREARGAGPKRRTRELAELAQGRGARFLAGVAVFDAPVPTRLLALDAGGEVLELSAGRVVLATGASERFLPFPGWTLPGVCGAGGLQALVKGGMEIAGRRVAVAGSGPLLLAVADFLQAHGARLLGVFEQAPRSAVLRFGAGLWRHPGKLAQGVALLARLRGVERQHDAWPVRAEGEGRLERLTLSVGGRFRSLECDLLACGFGLVPATQLAELCGCALREGAVVVDELQRTSVADVLCAGESAGIGGVEVALVEGEIAGHAAAGREELARALLARRARERGFAAALARAYALREELRSLADDATIVCRCEDVPFGLVRTRADARQAKLETRAGMGPCQGRVCGAALEFTCGWARDRVRPPLVPVPMRALVEAGARTRPAREETSS